MNTLINQTLWANSLNVDEVVPWEVKNLCNLMNAIFSEAIANQVNKLRKEKCCGCMVDHPSKKRDECLMMSKEDYHEHVTKHFENLKKNHETTLEILKDLKFKSDISEYQAILGYLSYWSKNH